MKKRKKLPKSLRKYIRQEKAHLRRQILDLKEQKKEIEKIYLKLGLEKEPVSSSPAEATSQELVKKKIK